MYHTHIRQIPVVGKQTPKCAMAFRHARRANVPVQEVLCSKIYKIISDLTHQPLSKETIVRFHGKPNVPKILDKHHATQCPRVSHRRADIGAYSHLGPRLIQYRVIFYV